MTDLLYTVDPTRRDLTAVEPVAFADIGIRERADLEAWICKQPRLLGEELLVVTSEFHRFDRSDKRLDVLALDKTGRLVVVELKLELTGTPADQQAIRYAAFCSTMTIQDVLDALASHSGCGQEEAEQKVLEFLDEDSLPELDAHPRIILAAGELDDQELTSVVLWLRTFGLDITCVELTPYRLPGKAEVLLVPRVIIPLPEAKEYIVSVEKKEAARAATSEGQQYNQDLWRQVGAQWNALSLPLQTANPPPKDFFQLRFGGKSMHFEWLVRKRKGYVAAALHFEDSVPSVNIDRLRLLEGAKDALRQGNSYEVEAGHWSNKERWTRLELRFPLDLAAPKVEVARRAVAAMRTLYDATWPIVEAKMLRAGPK